MLLALIAGSLFLTREQVLAVTTKSPALLEFSGNEEEPITINSKRAEFDNKRQVGIYSGEVVVKRGDTTLYADKIEVKLDPKTKRIMEIAAEGRVRIIQKDRELTAQHAAYFEVEKKLVLTGNPKTHQGENTINGSRMTYFWTEDRIVVEEARSVFYPSAGTAIK